MVAKHSPKKPKRTAAELTRLNELRRRFQSKRPSLAALVAGGQYTSPIAQPEFLMMLELASALQKARKSRGLSLAAVARRSGIDKAALSRIENGRNINPTIGTLETIARAVGARLDFRLELTRS